MSQYRLVYFNTRGRAELCRLVLVAADASWEDVRLTKEEWLSYKHNTPFGQLPVLEVDGRQVAQSHSIVRFLSKSLGLAGNTLHEEARADMIAEYMRDIARPLVAIYAHSTPEKKEAAKLKYESEQLPVFLEHLNRVLLQNRDGDGFFVGDQLTYADLAFVSGLEHPRSLGIKVNLDSFPKLQALRNKVEGLPNIAQWLKMRPDSDR